MARYLNVWLVAGGLFLVIGALIEAGRRYGAHRRRISPETAAEGLSAIDGAIFGLMALLIAFTFSGAASRFDTRRAIIGQEANAIGTAYLRLDLLPEATQPQLRRDFRDYLDLRIAIYPKIRQDIDSAREDQARANEIQQKIWKQAVAACQQVNSNAVTSLVLSSLNDMIDITTTRLVSQQTHPPDIIFYGMGVLVLATSLLAGYGMGANGTQSWLHVVLYAIILSTAVYVILDLEYPRVGFIRLDNADQVLINLRSSMK
jgi:hypothetical protein